jgi:hypothetical protein
VRENIDCCITGLLTPITNTSSVLSSCVKHRADNHETRCDGPLTHTKNESNSEETSEVLASGMTAHCNGPDENVQTEAYYLRCLRPNIVVPLTSSIYQQGTFAKLGFAGIRKQDS